MLPYSRIIINTIEEMLEIENYHWANIRVMIFAHQWMLN